MFKTSRDGRTVYMVLFAGIFQIKYTVIYGVCIRSWLTLKMSNWKIEIAPRLLAGKQAKALVEKYVSGVHIFLHIHINDDYRI